MNAQEEFENFEACMEGHETAADIFEAGWNARGKAIGTALGTAKVLSEGQQEVVTSPMTKRRVFDAIRGAYDLGFEDARNAKTVPGDSAPGYKGREVEQDHGSALLRAIATTPPAAEAVKGWA